MSFEPRDEAPAKQAAPVQHAVALRYPLQWYASSQTFAEAAAREATDALAGMRVVDATGAARRVHGLGVAGHGSWPYGGASPQRLATVLRFFTLWSFDDALLDAGEAGEAEIVAAIRGDDEPVPGERSHLFAWWTTARRYRAAMGAAWCARFAERFADWLTALRAEAGLTAALRSGGAHPTLDAYMPVRMIHVGVQPALDLIEYACGCPLPLQVRMHPATDAVRRYAARLVAIQNDLTGLGKDLADELPNLVGCLLRAEGLPAGEALAQVEGLHDESLCGLTGATQWLRAEFPRCDNLARWLRGVQVLCHGFARWHIGNGRYVRPHALPDGSRLALEIEYV